MADKMSKMILPIKNPSTGVITNKEFEFPSGGSITVDSALSDTSENPVQNKVVKTAIDGKSNTGHNHDDRYYTEAEVNNIVTTLSNADIQKIERNGTTFTVTRNDGTTFTFNQQDSDTKYSNGTGLDLSGTTFSVKYGTAAGTACQGNDSRLSDSRNAKDVYAWAKASTKPTYTASEVGAIASSAKGAANGVAELDSSGKVPSSQLPSYVDDTIEGYLYNSKWYKESAHTTEITGETGKIYVDLSTNKTYRWSGSAFVEISASLALGETSSTAYRGDRGKTAYDHSQSTHARTDATKTEASSTNGNIKINGTETTVYTHPGSGTNPHGTTKSDVGLGNVGNFKAVSTVASQGLTDTEKANARANIGAGTSSFSGSYNDLTNKPTIPTVNNATLTIQKNGTTVKTFTANASSNATANITVPTKTSELTNDSSFTSNTGTVTKVSTGAGLKGGDITTSGTVKANLKSETQSTLTASSKGSTANREYAVGLDVNGNLSVNIPWEDNNTTYNVVSTTQNGLAPKVTNTSNFLKGDGTWATPTNTKNTAGATDSSSKLFIIGATSQGANPQTYSQDTAYIGIDGCLYSGGAKVLTSHQDISGKMDANLKGVANGVAELDSSGKVLSSQLPSYVDDVLEYKNLSSFPTTGEAGKIYIAQDTNKTYRWSGSAYTEISASLALGETSSTAYRGDRGKTAYNHATDANRLTTATASGLYKIAATANGHVQSLTAVQKSDITALGIPSENTTYSSKSAVSGGTDVSLVTTGEKYTWNTTNGTVAQHTTDIASLNTGLASKIGTYESQQDNRILNIVHNINADEIIAYDEKLAIWFPLWSKPKLEGLTFFTPASNVEITYQAIFKWGEMRIVQLNLRLLTQFADGALVATSSGAAPINAAYCTCRDGRNHLATFAMNPDRRLVCWGANPANNDNIYPIQLTYFV